MGEANKADTGDNNTNENNRDISKNKDNRVASNNNTDKNNKRVSTGNNYDMGNTS